MTLGRSHHTKKTPEYIKASVKFMLAYAKRKQLDIRSVLDIGAGAGEALELFDEAGLYAAGIDPQPGSPLVTRATVYDLEKKVLRRKICEAYIDPFDAVFMNHSLEHMDNPNRALWIANGLMKMDAVIFVGVPSPVNSWGWDMRKYKSHYSCFPKKFLHRILERWGFRVKVHTKELRANHQELWACGQKVKHIEKYDLQADR